MLACFETEDTVCVAMDTVTNAGCNAVTRRDQHLPRAVVQIAKDMERLKLAREKREQQRQERIKKEGWDRFAPVTSQNKPPDGRPSDHPDFKK